MSDITEKEIEQYIRYPESLDAERRLQVKQAIQASAEYQEIAAFFREYDRLFTDIVRQKCRSHVVDLHFFRPDSSSGSSNRLVLAAQAGREQAQQLRTVATLASDENQTLVRILREDAETYRIHVISPLLESGDISILSFADLGIDLVISEEGRLRFSPDFDLESYDWSSASFSLRLPVKAFSIPLEGENEDKKAIFENPPYSLVVEQQGSRLAGTISYDGEGAVTLSRAVVQGQSDKPAVVPVMDQTFAAPVNSQEEMVTIWLYE